MSQDQDNQLMKFYVAKQFNSKGKLSVALVITQHAKKSGLPLNPDELITKGGGQVLGLGKDAVQSILSRHNIEKVLAKEGGRTSRGSISAMREYALFLNDLNTENSVDLDNVEKFWVERVKVFFSAKPFKIKLDSSLSLRTLIKDLIDQAETKQKESQGVYYVGAILQHLVGAKLDLILGESQIIHNSFSTSDEQSGRHGDFFVGDVAIHVTTTPTESLIQKCRKNIDDDLRPLIITTAKGLPIAEGLAEYVKLGNRIDVFEIQQFLSSNIYEFAKFTKKEFRPVIANILERYNEIVSMHETDPSLRIEISE